MDRKANWDTFLITKGYHLDTTEKRQKNDQLIMSNFSLRLTYFYSVGVLQLKIEYNLTSVSSKRVRSNPITSCIGVT